MAIYRTLLLFSLALIGLQSTATAQLGFTLELDPINVTNAPGIQSYSWAKTTDGKWLVLGGRLDGLHQRQPFSAFLKQDNNALAFLIDPVLNETWFADLSILPEPIFEQIQSTNQNFHQRENMLYIAGGYGRSDSMNDHVTFDGLIAIDVDSLALSIISGADVSTHFRIIHDPLFKICGGQMNYLDSIFYLVGGHLFDGRYNPMGPNNGPGFIQQYSNEIRKFKIHDDGVSMSLYDVQTEYDSINLHRRDYNLAPQIFQDGTYGFTAFSGVFNYDDMPYLNSVDILAGTYSVNNSFNQLLSQYHSAKLPIYDTVNNKMHTLFFGGLSQFTIDDLGNLIEDVDVPFVRTISAVTRNATGAMSETKLNYIEMPELMGPGSEFIPANNYYYHNKVLNFSALPAQRTLVGYIYGGIKSSAENIFFVNDGTLSSASSTIFEVYINKSLTSSDEYTIGGEQVFNLRISPNPAGKKLKLEFFTFSLDSIRFDIYNSGGELIQSEQFIPEETGNNLHKLDVSALIEGMYYLRISNASFQSTHSFVKR